MFPYTCRPKIRGESLRSLARPLSHPPSWKPQCWPPWECACWGEYPANPGNPVASLWLAFPQGPDPSLARLGLPVSVGDQEANQKLDSSRVATEYLGLEGLGLISTQSVTEQIKRDSWWHPNYTTLNRREDASIIIIKYSFRWVIG